MDLVRRHHGHRRRGAVRRVVRTRRRARTRVRGHRHPHVQPADGLREGADGDRVRSTGHGRRRRRHRARPGHPQGARRARIRRRRGRVRRSPQHPRPGQPRWIRRIQPDHVRGAREHRRRAHPLHGRRHRDRARLDPAGARHGPLREGADTRRWPDAQPAGTKSPARDGREDRHRHLHVGWRPERRVRPRLRREAAPRVDTAAPPDRRRLQRLVDVPHPAGGRRDDRSAAAAVHQVGRRRVRTASPRGRVPHGDSPGAAIWHMAWSDKDDAIDWQAYFHLRNRLVVAALHSRVPPAASW